MNYYKALEIRGEDGKPTGLWHFTHSRDNQTRPYGYCSPWLPCPNGLCNSVIGRDISTAEQDKCPQCNNKGWVKVQVPCPGHATKAEAIQHWHQYVLDYELTLNGVLAPVYRGHQAEYDCEYEGCGHKTIEACTWGPGMMGIAWLCEKHRTRQHVLECLKVTTELVSSY